MPRRSHCLMAALVARSPATSSLSAATPLAAAVQTERARRTASYEWRKALRKRTKRTQQKPSQGHPQTTNKQNKQNKQTSRSVEHGVQGGMQGGAYGPLTAEGGVRYEATIARQRLARWVQAFQLEELCHLRGRRAPRPAVHLSGRHSRAGRTSRRPRAQQYLRWSHPSLTRDTVESKLLLRDEFEHTCVMDL
jgi:hypothetical protein